MCIALSSCKQSPTDQYADYLFENYAFDTKDDATTVALWLRAEDTVESEVINRYQDVINLEIEKNQ